ncbi:MAG TPA: hypothetical protein VFA50_03635 [Stellaceae bacterium]|nr:hypothetical protein [Stellaceae bacterium]
MVRHRVSSFDHDEIGHSASGAWGTVSAWAVVALLILANLAGILLDRAATIAP